jgi:zinc finger CCHC domain-containing protein 9
MAATGASTALSSSSVTKNPVRAGGKNKPRSNIPFTKPKMTKDDRRAKYTDIARKRRQKQQGIRNGSGGGRGGGRFGSNNMVCYQCRQPGHSISDCPTMKQSQGGQQGSNKEPDTSLEFCSPTSSLGICYKCGSTEHALAQCPKRRRRSTAVGDDGGDENEGDLPFATCFLCHEKGHLVSGCPQNKRGIYVNGGSCRECGSQQHRVTECPEKKKKKAAQKNGTGENDDDSDNIAELLERDERLKRPTKSNTEALVEASTKKPKRRVVKF